MLIEDQNTQLQQQILCYKNLVRNISLPKNLEANVLELTSDQWEEVRDKLYEKSIRNYYDKPEKYEELKKLISHYNQNKKPTASQSAAEGGQPEIDPNAAEYVERISYFLERRKFELNKLISSGALPDEARLRAAIEAKFLDSLPIFEKVKEGILKGLLRSKPKRNFEKTYLDRKYFTRERPAKKYEQKSMEKLDTHIRNEQEQRKKIRHREFLRDLHHHQAMFFEFHKKKQKVIKKRSLGFKAYIEMIEKRGTFLLKYIY